MLSSPRSSAHLEDLDLYLPSHFTPVPPEVDEQKITMETIIQNLVKTESVYVDELAAITKVQSGCALKMCAGGPWSFTVYAKCPLFVCTIALFLSLLVRAT